jgi:murein DD-endopeptidase MepM/ murein hydrolase activator NlpD
MPALRTRYFALAAVALVVVVIGAILLASGGQKPDGVGSIGPTPSATAPANATTGPVDSDAPTTETPLPSGSAPPSAPPISNAKDATPVSAEPEDLEGYIWPAQHALITSRFAPRDFGGFVIIDGQEVHDGLDLATHCGNKVHAAHGGVVLYAGRNFDPYIGYWGDPTPIYARLERLGRVNEQPIVIVIDDGNGYRSMYVHLNEANVEAGMTVQAGDNIGLEGATGYATGCHLHYGLIRMDGDWQEVVPRLARFGYPPYVRERIDPLRVLFWGDEFAPQKLRDKFYGTPSPLPETPSPTDALPSPPEPTPAPDATPTPLAS